MVLLTDEEIQSLFDELKLDILAERRVKRQWWLFPFMWTWEFLRDTILLNIETSNAIKKAQLKNVAEWGDTFCVVNEHYGVDKRANTRKRCCNLCWQALLKEIE